MEVSVGIGSTVLESRKMYVNSYHELETKKKSHDSTNIGRANLI